MLHIVAPGATEQHETIADGLHHFGVQLLGKLGEEKYGQLNAAPANEAE